MHIVLTGGHLTPAYAFAEYALSKGDMLSLITSQPPHSPEVTELTKLAIPSYYLKTVKYNRYQKLRSVLRLPGLIPAYFKSLQLLTDLKPEVVVTFGSFMAVPVSLAAKTKRIPIILHEQTHTAGLANQLVAPFASACAISYPESINSFPQSKTQVTGNLLRSEFFNPPLNPPFMLPSKYPIIFVTGGSQGSQVIINTLKPLLAKLSEHYQIVIQSGKTDFELNPSLKPKIIQRSWFTPAESAWLMHHAKIIISRAGANTTAEIMVAGTPAILIPLAGSAGNEQMINAQSLVSKGAAILIPQQECSPDQLVTALSKLEANYEMFKTHAQSLITFQHQDAVTRLYDLVTNTLQTANVV